MEVIDIVAEGSTGRRLQASMDEIKLLPAIFGNILLNTGQVAETTLNSLLADDSVLNIFAPASGCNINVMSDKDFTAAVNATGFRPLPFSSVSRVVTSMTAEACYRLKLPTPPDEVPRNYVIGGTSLPLGNLQYASMCVAVQPCIHGGGSIQVAFAQCTHPSLHCGISVAISTLCYQGSTLEEVRMLQLMALQLGLCLQCRLEIFCSN